MFESRHPSHGFRFSILDAVVLLVGAGLPWLLWSPVGHLALLIPFTVFHFFLFCNVLRVPRGCELLWAGVFVVNVGTWVVSGAFTWWGVLGVQLPVTVAVLAYALQLPSYHGIGSRAPRETT